MARETVGYVKLEWTCPNCITVNPGPEKKCLNCGAAQPADVAFDSATHDELIKDEKEIAAAKAGPDIYCAYCGTRNPGNTKDCSNCGANLAEGKARQSGQVLGSLQDKKPVEKVICPACGTENLDTQKNCNSCGAQLPNQAKNQAAAAGQPEKTSGLPARTKYILIGIVALAVLGCLFFVISNLTSRDEIQGVVNSVRWERQIELEEFGPVTREDWQSEIPAEGKIGSCERKLHHTQAEPVDGAEKICGTPYKVDSGSGYGEVVQDCEYQVYLDYCQYQIDDWKLVQTLSAEGNDFNPYWPEYSLTNNQRFGDQVEQFAVQFESNQGNYNYRPSSMDEYVRFVPGSNWLLTVNGFNDIVSIEPAR